MIIRYKMKLMSRINNEVALNRYTGSISWSVNTSTKGIIPKSIELMMAMNVEVLCLITAASAVQLKFGNLRLISNPQSETKQAKHVGIKIDRRI